MAALVQARKALIAFSDDIDYEKFLILHELNVSREIYPFSFFAWDEARFQRETRFRKGDLFVLLEVFQIPIRTTT